MIFFLSDVKQGYGDRERWGGGGGGGEGEREEERGGAMNAQVNRNRYRCKQINSF